MKYNVVLINDNKNELQKLIDFFDEVRDINLDVIDSDVAFETYIQNNPIHLILAHEKCISIDPLSLCQHIRLLDQLNFLPFLYFTKSDDLKVIQHAYEVGVNECIKPPFSLDELLFKMHRYIINYEALKKCLGQNERLAIVLATDQLTKVSNRMHLQTLLRQAIKEYKRYDRIFSITYFRVHNMQKINSIYGFTKGDRLLKEVAQFVAKQIRASDVIARWGGGDFIILTPNTSAKDARKLAQKLYASLQTRTFLPSFTPQLHFGITQVDQEDDIYTIVERARKALNKSVQNHTIHIVTI